MNCDQCEALMIQGVFCHEIRCPRENDRWIDVEWVRFVRCYSCGDEVEKGALCYCGEDGDDDEVGARVNPVTGEVTYLWQ